MERKGTDTKIEEMTPRELKSLETGSIVQVEVIAYDGAGSGVYLVEYTPGRVQTSGQLADVKEIVEQLIAAGDKLCIEVTDCSRLATWYALIDKWQATKRKSARSVI